MFTKKEKIEVLKAEIVKKYIGEEGLFKGGLKGKVESPVKKIGDIEYTYGADEIFEYFILVDEKREGYIWAKVNYKEDGVYKNKDIVIATEGYKEIKGIIEREFNIKKFRDNFVEMIRAEDRSEIEYSIEKVIGSIYFGNRIRKPQRMKVIGLLVYLFRRGMEGVFEKNIGIGIKEKYNEWRLKIREYKNIDINSVIGEIITREIEYIVKEGVDINTIEWKLGEG